MFCKACGAQVPDGAAFCPVCGNQVGPVETTAAVHGAPPPRRNSRLGLWIGMAAAAAILIAAGLVLWLVVLDDDETATTTSTTSTSPAQTTSTGVAPPATAGGAAASTSSTSASTASTSIAEMMIPGDSPGQWMEIDNSAFPTGAYAVALSVGGRLSRRHRRVSERARLRLPPARWTQGLGHRRRALSLLPADSRTVAYLGGSRPVG